MAAFKDHFSKQSDQYSKFRPDYPDAMFQYLAGLCMGHDLLWDCATGSGQAARGFSPYFKKIYASDGSEKQINNAHGPDNIDFVVADAAKSGLADHSVDLVSVAQALHWFDLDAFYAEVRRVLKPGGIIAVWCYGLMEIDPEIDTLFYEFYDGVVGPYWPPERVHIERGYSDLDFPFEKIETPAFAMDLKWDLDAFLGYLSTWSATTRYIAEKGHDPVALYADKFRVVWKGQPYKEINWPITLLAGRV
ncbi:MAG: class I SAM-dependent methyltransferase [Kordiimonadaceae bacterium]|nr:class I SAM-dependent methyltransferase [Kordiimonadaceae bacterium]